jgi:hypothetical protein
MLSFDDVAVGGGSAGPDPPSLGQGLLWDWWKSGEKKLSDPPPPPMPYGFVLMHSRRLAEVTTITFQLSNRYFVFVSGTVTFPGCI